MPSLNDILTDTNLYNAWIKVHDNQGCAGVDGVRLTDFSKQLWLNLQTLSQEVQYGSYRPKPLFRVNIDKKTTGTRPLSIPVVRDRILQTATSLALTPLFEQEFEDISYAYRKGRSVKQAIGRIEILRNQGYQWVVDADIQCFFDQVDHRLLLQQIAQLVNDKDILRLIGLWLSATVVDGKQRYQLKKGIPQGSPMSPMLANLYLDQLDEALLDQHYKIIRYADDFVILCKSEQRAEQALQLSSEVLEQLRLCFNQAKTSITHFNRGFRFLGVEFIRSLVFKAQYPEVANKVSHPLPVQQIKQQQPQPVSPALPLTGMQQAFFDARITPGIFVPQAIADLPTPSEHAEPEALAIEPSDAPNNSRYDPRLKTLYLLRHGLVLGKASERFIIRFGEAVEQEIPAIHVDQIMVFGNAQITTQAMQFSLQKNIPIFLLSSKGYYYGVVDSFNTESVVLHRQQFLQADDPIFCRQLSTAILQGKLANSRLILQRINRRQQSDKLTQAVSQISTLIKQLPLADSLDQLRGYEGACARIYFQALVSIVDPAWQFTKRNKNPPVDPINAMLSYGYTLLFYNVYTFLRTRGLNPHIGHLHPVRQGHPALVSDMMEEFRAIIVDSVVFNLVMNHKLSPDDFIMPTGSGEPCLLTAQARRIFIQQLEGKMNSRLHHPVSGLKLDYRRCIEHQINHLVAVLRQTTATYQAMILR